MSKAKREARIVVFIVASVVLSGASAAARTERDREVARYSFSVDDDGVLLLKSEDAPVQQFLPRFLVMRVEHDPMLATRPGNLGKLKYNVATWIGRRGGEGISGEVDTGVVAGDGHDPSILTGDSQNRTADYFSAAEAKEWVASRVRKEGAVIEWVFRKNEYGTLVVKIHPSVAGLPVLDTRFVASEPGYYSIGYAGATSTDFSEVEDAWQPLVWQGRRFPYQSFLTLAYRCTLPAPMVTRDSVTTSVIVDPQVFPFQPLPVAANSRFGVAVRNEQGQAQPLVFAPVLGGPGSKMNAGDTRTFRLRLFAHAGNTKDNYERIAREVYDFHDNRTNATGSLNEALYNMIAYGMSEYSQFNDELRGCSYATDVPGAVKNVSSLHPLSAALVTDNPEIYERRARPIIEYMLSREKFLFAVSPEVKIQNPSWRLKGPCAPASELAALHSMTQGKNAYLLGLAKKLSNQRRTLNLDTPIPAGRWDTVHAVACASGDDALLQLSVQKAEEYVEQESNTAPGDFANRDASFWDQLVPRFPELLNLYESTGDERFLDAAHDAARRYAQFVWMCPRIPDGQVLVNQGSQAPHYWYLRSKGHSQMSVPEERVDAWRVSEIGLTPEGPQTSNGHRGVFIATHAPWMMRIGHLTGDTYLEAIARSAVVGRYRNFPGYHMNTGRTTVYEAVDYPLRDHRELSYNSFHYNHIWPHAALLIDYLVSEAFARSNGAIEFPSRFAEGYAYLKNRVYGDRPGRFYAEQEVWLWMPAGLIEMDTPDFNYLSARKGDVLFVALSNQSFAPQRATIRFDPSLAQLTTAASVRLCGEADEARAPRIEHGAVTVDVPAEGLVALAIDGVKMPARRLEPSRESEPRSDGDVNRMVQLPFAEQTTGFLIDALGRRSAYVYLQATHETVDLATLHYRIGGAENWQSIEDVSYPFEYTLHLPGEPAGLTFYVETRSPNGETSRSDEAQLGLIR